MRAFRFTGSLQVLIWRRKTNRKIYGNRRKLIFGILLAVLVVATLAGGAWWVVSSQAAAPKEAPEAQKVLDLQAGMPFQILIPAYLPKQFRARKDGNRCQPDWPGR